MKGLPLANKNLTAALDDCRSQRALSPTMTVAEALRLLMSECRAQIRRQRALLLTSDDPEGIHQTRVALRQVRAILMLFGNVVDDPRLRAIDAEARRLARECGPARELHVFLSETAPDAPAEVARVGRELGSRHLRRARQALSGEAFARFDASLREFIGSLSRVADETLSTFARHELDACLRRVRRRGRALRRLSTSGLHRLRIAAKRLRYAAASLAPIFPTREAAEYIQFVEALQDALGKLNDRSVGKRVLSDITAATRLSKPARTRCKRLAKHLASGKKRDRRRIERAWKTFRRAEPFWERANEAATHPSRWPAHLVVASVGA